MKKANRSFGYWKILIFIVTGWSWIVLIEPENMSNAWMDDNRGPKVEGLKDHTKQHHLRKVILPQTFFHMSYPSNRYIVMWSLKILNWNN